MACSLLALAHEELGKSILFRVVAKDPTSLRTRLESPNGGPRRPLVDDHGGKFDLAVGLIVHDDLERSVIQAFEYLLRRKLSPMEVRAVGSCLLGGRMRVELREGGLLSEIITELGPRRSDTLVDLVEEMIEWVRAEYDDLVKIKLRGLYVDLDPRTGEVLVPEEAALPDFRALSKRLEVAIERMKNMPTRE